MEKKGNKANENIEILIDEICSLKLLSFGICCPYSYKGEKHCEEFKSDCDYCKEQYVENMRENMTKKYIVN